jgi:hypothetical protein
MRTPKSSSRGAKQGSSLELSFLAATGLLPRVAHRNDNQGLPLLRGHFLQPLPAWPWRGAGSAERAAAGTDPLRLGVVEIEGVARAV